MQLTKHFNSSEFDSPDILRSGRLMDKAFMCKLESDRVISSIPYIINSGFRSRVHNRDIGGKSESSHLIYLAADISCVNSRQRALILKGLILAGFRRIGISKSFIHIDTDPGKDDSE